MIDQATIDELRRLLDSPYRDHAYCGALFLRHDSEILDAAARCQRLLDEAERALRMEARLAELRRDVLPVLDEILGGKESFVMVDGRGLPVAKATAERLKGLLEV